MRTMTVAALLVLVALAGCAADEPGPEPGPSPPADPVPPPPGPGPEPEPEPDPEPEPPAGPDPKRDPVTWEVEVRDNSFFPKELTIQVGDTVKWVRAGTQMHTVTEEFNQFHSGSCPGPDCFMPGGRQEFSFAFDTVEEVRYHCEPHAASMQGTIEVLERHDDTP